MDTKEGSVLEYKIDKNQVPPIDQKRIVAFINHFLVSTVSFLNKFAVNCETKFIDFESKLQKVEASLAILEAKVASIPGIDHTSIPKAIVVTSNIETNTAEPTASLPSSDTVDKSPVSTIAATVPNNDGNEEQAVPIETTVDGVKTCDDIRYKKYFKMIQFGVPATAVKLKMDAEGIDPTLLDEPNRILENGIASMPDE